MVINIRKSTVQGRVLLEKEKNHFITIKDRSDALISERWSVAAMCRDQCAIPAFAGTRYFPTYYLLTSKSTLWKMPL